MANKLLSELTPRLYLDRRTDELTAFLQKIVRLRTVNPPGENYGPLTLLLASTLKDLGFKVQRIPIPRALQKKPCLTCSLTRVTMSLASGIQAPKKLFTLTLTTTSSPSRVSGGMARPLTPSSSAVGSMVAGPLI